MCVFMHACVCLWVGGWVGSKVKGVKYTHGCYKHILDAQVCNHNKASKC